MENKNYFTTYKFYNRKGQRLSIFATTKEGSIDRTSEPEGEVTTCGLSLYIVRHSKTPDPVTKKVDRFSKKWVRQEFEKGQLVGSFTDTEIDPVIVNLPCTQGDSKRVFMDYCNRNFYKLEVSSIFGTNIGLQFDALIKRSFNGAPPEVLILPNSVHQVKALPLPQELSLEGIDFLELNDGSDENPPTMPEDIENFLRESGITD